MTNGEEEVMRVLEEAVRAATGQERQGIAGVAEPAGTGDAGDPAVAFPGKEQELSQSADRESRGSDQRPEGALGIGSWLAPLAGLESLAGAASGNSGVSKAVAWVNPLVGGLMELFGGDRAEPQAGPAKAVRPGRINYEAGFAGSGGSLVEMDRDESGRLRDASPMAQVVVNVDAIDSRSFLDRTPEIAEAVQRALLESGSIRRLMNEE